MRPSVALVAAAFSTAVLVAAADTGSPLTCMPEALQPGDTLVLSFTAPHPSELAIRAPGRTWYFLVYEPDSNSPEGFHPIVSKAEFKGLSELKLPVNTAKGSPWKMNRIQNERIFTRPGEYQVYLSEVLESEREAFTCTVRLEQ